MSEVTFVKVLGWITNERRKYQTKKFDYDKEPDKPVEDWIRQFDSYIQRLPVFGLDTPQGAQAALKLAATAVALCEIIAEKQQLPRPGYPSGEIHL